MRSGYAHVLLVFALITATWPGLVRPSHAEKEPVRDRLKSAFDALTTESDTVRSIRPSAQSGRNVWANALDVVLPPPPNPEQLTGRVAALYAQSLHEYYAYYSSALRHRRALFDWQLLSGRIIFFVVILLVLSGVFFAAVQFFRGEAGEVSTLTASQKGIRVSSPVLGVIILTISLLFFYLYLAYVYPIHEAIIQR